MKNQPRRGGKQNRRSTGLLILTMLTMGGVITWFHGRNLGERTGLLKASASLPSTEIRYKARVDVNPSGVGMMMDLAKWDADATLPEIAAVWKDIGYRYISQIDEQIFRYQNLPSSELFPLLTAKMMAFNFEGNPRGAYGTLKEIRALLESEPDKAAEFLYTIIYIQGVTSLRLGENENCIMCRGESSCILPISKAAQHKNAEGSRNAILHFTEYLSRFPDDLEVQWLLNIAHMTLGEHPEKVDPKYVVLLDHWKNSEFDIGRFRDIGHQIGVNEYGQVGGSIMDDFDNDGRFDLVWTSNDPTAHMTMMHNSGDGNFENQTESAGLTDQLYAINCVQTDFNNDGFLDIFLMRGAWSKFATRPTLLKNNRDGTFADVTGEAGMLTPLNTTACGWADYNNDGLLDLFIACERQPNRLYRNLGDGKFVDSASEAGLTCPAAFTCKGVAWIDYDNDGYPDLFQNYMTATAESRLFHNNRDGTFTDVSRSQGIQGPTLGFSCWAFDYDNDGWMDLFATSYDHTLGDTVKGMINQPHKLNSNRLYHNLGGHGFEDVTKEAGLDMVFMTMGSNFGDLDNDGYLDFYLATGAPGIEMLVPNRMIKNVGGKRFADISASSGTGHLQKPHGISIGDWDRDGNNDLFVKMGGAIDGDQYHNIMFQNPGHDNHWLTVKLTGVKTNRPAIGARIKIVTAGPEPLTIHRHISTGSSWGANPLQQTIGVAKAERIATLEIYWPTSGTTQTFHDLDVNQAIGIKEFEKEFEKLEYTPLPVPAAHTAPKMTMRE